MIHVHSSINDCLSVCLSLSLSLSLSLCVCVCVCVFNLVCLLRNTYVCIRLFTHTASLQLYITSASNMTPVKPLDAEPFIRQGRQRDKSRMMEGKVVKTAKETVYRPASRLSDAPSPKSLHTRCRSSPILIIFVPF